MCAGPTPAQSIEFGDVFQLETILGENFWHGYLKVDFLDPWDGANLESYMAIDFIELAVNKDSLGGFGVNPEDRRFEEIRIGDIDGFGWGDGAALAAHNPAVASANDDLVNLPEKLPINRDGFGLLASGDFLPDIDADGAVDNSATGLEPGDDWDRRSGEEVAGTYYTGSGFTRSQVSYFPLGSQYTDITLSKSYSYSAEETDPVLTGDLARAFGPFPSADGHSATNGNTELVIDTDNDEIPDAVDPSNPGTILPGDVANHPFYFNFYVEPFAIDPAKPLYLTMTHGDLDTSLIEVELRDLRANAATATLMAAGTTDDGTIESSFVVLDETTLEFDDIFTWDAARNKWHGYLEVRFKNIDTATDDYFAIDFIELSTNMRNIGMLRVPEDYATVQGAVNASLHGDTVLVAPGIYRENIDFQGKNITLRSEDPLDHATVAGTMLDGDIDDDGTGDGSVITFDGSENNIAALHGFTIQNGKAVYGGGIAGWGTRASIEHNIITNNEAAYGGGIALCRGLVRLNTITANEATEDIEIDENNPFEATGIGGGVYNASELWQNNIHSNIAAIGGGGVWESHVSGESRLVNNLIHGNTVIDTTLAYTPGAGIHYAASGSDTLIAHNTIVDNTWNSLVVNAIDEAGFARFRNNLLWDSITSTPTSPDTDWDRLQGSDLACNGIVGAPSKGTDAMWNFGNDPLFTNAATGDYTLQANSPAIDAGCELDPAILLDYAGSLRVAITPDAGTYEWGDSEEAQAYVVIRGPAVATEGDAVTLESRLSPTLQALVDNGATLAWQWQFDATDIIGATSGTLNIDPLALTDAGTYTVTALIDLQAHASMPYKLKVRTAEEATIEDTPITTGRLSLDPRHIDFGYVPVGESAERLLEVTNTSGAYVSGTISVVEGPFEIAYGTAPMPYGMDDGDYGNFFLRAIPTEPGEFKGRVVFSGGGEVTLSCRTTSNEITQAYAHITPSLLQFPYTAPFDTTDLTLTVTNIWDTPLEGRAVASTPFTVLEEGYLIPPGETQVLTVRFAPTVSGDYAGHIAFTGGYRHILDVYATSAAGNDTILTGVRINEVAPWNTYGLELEPDVFPDWIELYNENATAVDLSGWYLTDSDDNTATVQIMPTGSILPANGYLIVYADLPPTGSKGQSKGTTTSTGTFFTGFALDEVNGGYVGLHASDDSLVDSIVYPAATQSNLSYIPAIGYSVPSPYNPWNIKYKRIYITPYINPTKNPFAGAQTPAYFGMIADPTIPITRFEPLEMSHYLEGEDFLKLLQSYSNYLFKDQSGSLLSTTKIKSEIDPTKILEIYNNEDMPVHAQVIWTIPSATTWSSDIPSDSSLVAKEPLPTHVPKVLVERGGDLWREDHWRAARTLTDNSLLIASRYISLDKNGVPGEYREVQGITPVCAGFRGIIIFTEAINRHAHVEDAENLQPGEDLGDTSDDFEQSRFHVSTFTHELGHFMGILGGPGVEPHRPGPNIMSHMDGVPTASAILGTSHFKYSEPWWRVKVIAREKAMYEGGWVDGENFLRRQAPSNSPASLTWWADQNEAYSKATPYGVRYDE